MGKAIFWVVVILGVLMLARVLARSKAASAEKSKARQANPPQAHPASSQGDPEAMVRCAHCGVHLPRSEARMLGGNTWCSNEHARLGARKQG